jgi:hypothetical protein
MESILMKIVDGKIQVWLEIFGKGSNICEFRHFTFADEGSFPLKFNDPRVRKFLKENPTIEWVEDGVAMRHTFDI